MSCLLHKLEEQGKEAEEILKILRETRQLLKAYKQFTATNLPDSDITRTLALNADALKAQLHRLTVRPV